jgi:hypothetical protein
MISKYDTVCGACYEAIAEGDLIEYDDIFQKWVHPMCKTVIR